jgi:UDP-glucose 4-epimerase
MKTIAMSFEKSQIGPMKILVTGGAGFIGSNIVELYLAEGHEVVVIDDLSTGQLSNLPSDVHVYEHDIGDAAVAKILQDEQPDIVNHHAAQVDVRRSFEDPAADAMVNIVSSVRLLEACRLAKVKKFIFASSGGAIYGLQQTFPADETHPTTPQNPYGIAKLTLESYLAFYHTVYGIPFVALRYANVYGPKQGLCGEAGVVAIFIQAMQRGLSPTIYGKGDQSRDFVYVDDVVACNVAALGDAVQGIYNVGTGVETDVATLMEHLTSIMGVDIAAQPAPERRREVRRSSVAPGALQSKTHTPFLEGLKKTVAWFDQYSV